jgi:hypothetical protein
VINFSVDHSGPWWTGSFIENPALIERSLSDVRMIMTIMRVFMVELLCQAVTERISVLEYLLPVIHGHRWLRFVLLRIPPGVATEGLNICSAGV